MLTMKPVRRLSVYAALIGFGLPFVPGANAQTPDTNPTVQTEGQTGETASVEPTEAQKAQMLAEALEKLEAKTPKLDEQTRKLVPGFRAIITRYYTDKASLTQEEKKILFALRQWLELGLKSRDINLEEMDATFVTKVKQSGAIQKPPRVVAGERKTPGAKEPMGYVALVQGEQERIIAEIPNGAGGLTPKQRARKVANRLATASAADPLWWTGATVARKKGAYVVAAATAPDGYVITADNDYARLRGLSPDKLANVLMRDIRQIYGGAGTRDVVRSTPTEAAARLREQGDMAYSKGNKAGAETLYKQAIERDAQYLPAYERLAAMYQAQNNKSACRAIARRALTLSNLTGAEKQRLAQMAK